jgi:hypothetical protein
MKKVFYSIFAAVLAVACTTFEVEEPLQIVNVDKPVISDVVVGETTLSAKLTPKEGTSFYSYAVIAGAAAELDPTTLFKLGYKSKAVVTGTVDASKSANFTVEAGSAEKPLSRDADYTIYAVAASTQGTVGEIEYKTVHTGDSEVPKATGFSAKGNVITLKFSEAVSIDESKALVAKYYAENLVAMNSDKTALASDGLVGDAKAVAKLAADGKSVDFTVTLPDDKPLPAGAIYTVSYPASTFKDNVGNEIAALASGPAVDNSKIVWGGLKGQIAKAAWSLVDNDAEGKVVLPSKSYFLYSFPADVTVYGASKAPAASIKVESKKTTANYSLEYGVDWGLTSGMIAIFYPDGFAISGGSDLTITIDAGAFVDIYGNESKALSHKYLYSYGYTVADVVGTYTYEGVSYFGATYNETGAVVFEESDNADKGNVMITTIFDAPCAAPIYCSFDGDFGILTIADGQIITPYVDGDDNGNILFAVNNADEVTFFMSEPGKFINNSAGLGYYYNSKVSSDNSGWGNAFSTFTMTRNAAAPAPAKGIIKPVSLHKSL